MDAALILRLQPEHVPELPLRLPRPLLELAVGVDDEPREARRRVRGGGDDVFKRRRGSVGVEEAEGVDVRDGHLRYADEGVSGPVSCRPVRRRFVVEELELVEAWAQAQRVKPRGRVGGGSPRGERRLASDVHAGEPRVGWVLEALPNRG